MRLTGKVLAAGLASAVAFSAMAVPSAQAAKPTITVWIGGSADKVAALQEVAKKFTAATVNVVNYDGDLRDGLKTVAEKNAPDIFEGAHDWVGELASNGTIVKLASSARMQYQLYQADLRAMTYNGNLYGIPQLHESIAFVVNKAMFSKCPSTLADFLKNVPAGLDTPIQVGPDAYHFYPMLSGLGGGFFGRNSGGYDPNIVLVDSAKLLANSGIIDGWQKSGLFSNYAGSYDGDNGAYMTGKAAAWITGPWNSGVITAGAKKEGGVQSLICKFPTIVNGITSRPFSGVRGMMLSKFADGHGVETQAKAFLNYLATSEAQTTYAKKAVANPSNKYALNSAPAATRAFLATYPDAIPMPNIPEMAAIWGNVGEAWSKALAKKDPTAAKTAFKQAGQKIRATLAG